MFQAQRNGFQGPVCGPKPTTANKRQFTYEQLKAGQGIIGLQAGWFVSEMTIMV